jgi:periplasmic protein TonB
MVPAASAAPAASQQNVASAAAIADARASFAQRMAAHLRRHKRTVRMGWDRPRSGAAAKVAILMTREGKLLSVRIQSSSGVEALDEEALALVRRAQPLPPLPPEMPGESIELNMPLKLDD